MIETLNFLAEKLLSFSMPVVGLFAMWSIWEQMSEMTSAAVVKKVVNAVAILLCGLLFYLAWESTKLLSNLVLALILTELALRLWEKKIRRHTRTRFHREQSSQGTKSGSK